MSGPTFTVGLLAVMMVAGGVAACRVAGGPSSRTVRALGLLGLLAGFFPLFAALADGAARTDGQGALVLFGSAAVFKLMNRFESPV